MKKAKLLIENILVYGLGGVISKIIPFIMLPIVTRMMPNSSYYGLNDLFNTIASFAGAVAMMGMYDAMYRMFFEKEEESYKKDICSTTMTFSMIAAVVIGVIVVVLNKPLAVLVFDDAKYYYLVILAAINVVLSVINSIISAPTRMQNKRTIFLITNTLSPVISYTVAIIMLQAGHYVLALPLASVLALVINIIIFFFLNKSWFKPFTLNKAYLKDLLKIGLPLLPNFLIYWVFNSCDKLMITSIIDVGANGVYAVGSKLGHMSQLIYTAFGGGWLYFAYSTMHDDDQVTTNSRIFEYLGVISYACSIVVFALSKPLYQLMFEAEYVAGYIVAPYLFLAPLLQMLFQVACNQFMVKKKSWPNMVILLFGAILNVALNAVLIPVMGIEGAAVATLLGYAAAVIIAVIILTKLKLMNLSFKFLGCTILTLIYIILWRFFAQEKVVIGIVLGVVIIVGLLMVYKKDISSLLKGLKKKKTETGK